MDQERITNKARSVKAGEIFLEVQDMPPEQQQRLLGQRASGDALLKAEVESLLEADHQGRQMFPTPPSVSEIDTEQFEEEPMPESIGPYRVLNKLGEGGMGIVYLAQQKDPERPVALKRIRSELSSPRFVRRFRREGHALALMSHTNIGHIFEAATTPDGRPYLVMEYIEGRPIHEYCDARRLGVCERIELVIAAAHGIQHAHQKGRIHQDIKPTNVLVREQGNEAVPKIIDFGIAKEVVNESLAGRLSTEFRVVLGTLEYMSPEQIAGEAKDVDTRTDVYSLGALLYEVLTSALPFDPDILTKEQIRRAILEETPLLASRRVEGLGEKAAAVASDRSTDPKTLVHRLRGDLDWILTRAMEKDRGARYQTPSEFAADLRRHLENEPVLAGPPSRAYRVRKFVQRHRIAVSAAAMLLVTLLVGIAGTTVGLVRARRAERTAAAAQVQASQEADRATREATVAQKVTDFLVGLFRVPDPSEARGNKVTAREVLDRGALAIRNDLDTQPRVRARLMLTIAGVYRNLALHERAEPLVQEALGILKPLSPNGDLDVVEALNGQGSLLKEMGRFKEARESFEEALTILRRYVPADSLPVASSLNNIGTCLYEEDRDQEAIPILEEALQIRQGKLPPDAVELADSRMNLSLPLSDSSNEADKAKAREMLGTAIEVYRVKIPNTPSLAQALDSLGAMFAEVAQFKEAESLFVEALGIREHVLPADHPDIAGSHTNIGNMKLTTKEYGAARARYDRALGIYARAGFQKHFYALFAKSNLACLYIAIHEFEKGRRLHREVIVSVEAKGSEYLSYAAELEESFAGYLEEAGLHDEAVRAMKRAQDFRRKDTEQAKIWRPAIAEPTSGPAM